MSDSLRTRLADAIFTETTQIVFAAIGEDVEKRVAAIMSMSALRLADVLLSLPGIAIVDSPEGVLPEDGAWTAEYRAGWDEGYGYGFNEGLRRVSPPGYDVGTPDTPARVFTNVVVQADGVIVDESVDPYRKHNPATARAHAAALLAAANAAESDEHPEPLNYSGLDRSCDDYYGMGR